MALLQVEDARVPTRVKLAALWAAMMFLYVYADVLSFYRPGVLGEIEGGKMGPLDATQGSLLLAAVLVAIPAFLIALSVGLSPKASRALNVGFGSLYTLVNASDLVGESWAYYLVLGVLEIGLSLTITTLAWKWPRPDVRAA